MTFVDTERAVCQKDNYSVKRYRMSHRLNILGARRWIQSAFMSIVWSLDEGTIVAAYTHCKINLMSFKVFNGVEARKHAVYI